MSQIAEPLRMVEHVLLETHSRPWICLAMGGYGILAQAIIEGFDGAYMEGRNIALQFSQQVIQAFYQMFDDEQPSKTPTLLVRLADKVVKDVQYHTGLLCTTWRSNGQIVEICSVGTNSVLVFESQNVWEVVTPHSVNSDLQRQGLPTDPRGWRFATHVLGYKNSCTATDVRIASVPMSSTTCIAILVDRRLVDTILQQKVSQYDLSSFIDAWRPPGGIRNRTSVLITL